MTNLPVCHLERNERLANEVERSGLKIQRFLHKVEMTEGKVEMTERSVRYNNLKLIYLHSPIWYDRKKTLLRSEFF